MWEIKKEANRHVVILKYIHWLLGYKYQFIIDRSLAHTPLCNIQHEWVVVLEEAFWGGRTGPYSRTDIEKIHHLPSKILKVRCSQRAKKWTTVLLEGWCRAEGLVSFLLLVSWLLSSGHDQRGEREPTQLGPCRAPYPHPWLTSPALGAEEKGWLTCLGQAIPPVWMFSASSVANTFLRALSWDMKFCVWS